MVKEIVKDFCRQTPEGADEIKSTIVLLRKRAHDPKAHLQRPPRVEKRLINQNYIDFTVEYGIRYKEPL
jgi:hypothetical protein